MESILFIRKRNRRDEWMKWFSINGILTEMKRIRWPKAKDLFHDSGICVVFVLFLGIFFFVGVDVATNFISSKLMSIRFGWSDEQVKFAPQVYFLSRTIGALLGAFLLTRIAEMRYFRINIVACVVSLLVLIGVEKDVVNIVCIGAVGFFASSVFSIIYSMALQACPEKANQISGLMITAVAGGGVVTPVVGFAIGTVGIIGGVVVTLACVLYLTYCAFGIKVTSCVK